MSSVLGLTISFVNKCLYPDLSSNLEINFILDSLIVEKHIISYLDLLDVCDPRRKVKDCHSIRE